MGRPSAAFGNEVKRRREQRGWSAAQAAKRAGINSTTWRNVERDIRSETRDRLTVIRIARALGWDLDDALAVMGLVPATDEERREPADDPLRVIQEKFGRLTDRQKQVAADVVVSFAEPHAPLDRPDVELDDEPEVRATELEGGAVMFEEVPEAERTRSH